LASRNAAFVCIQMMLGHYSKIATNVTTANAHAGRSIQIQQ